MTDEEYDRFISELAELMFLYRSTYGLPIELMKRMIIETFNKEVSRANRRKE